MDDTDGFALAAMGFALYADNSIGCKWLGCLGGRFLFALAQGCGTPAVRADATGFGGEDEAGV